MATTTNNAWTIPVSTDLVKNGATAISTLGSAIDTTIGKSALAWQSWTPTLTGWGVGNGTWDAKYAVLGKFVYCTVYFVDGSSTTETTSFNFTLPPGYNAKSGYNLLGSASISTSTVNATGIVSQLLGSTTTATIFVNTASGSYTQATQILGGVPGTWAAGDYVKCSFFYEAA